MHTVKYGGSPNGYEAVHDQVCTVIPGPSLEYLRRLMDEEGFVAEPVAHDELWRDGWHVDYFTFRVTRALARG